MTHIHIAAFKWTASATDAQIREALDMICSVASRVDGIAAIYCGENTSSLSKGYSHVVVVLGDSAEAIQGYAADEVHKRAAALIAEIKRDVIGLGISDPR